MSSTTKTPTIINQLLALLPPKFSQRGQRLVLEEMRNRLKKLQLSFDEQGTLEGLPGNIWQKIMDNLKETPNGKNKSRETQRRYQIILMEIASTWKEQHWIETLPEIKISPQHPRQLTVRVDLLRGVRYSDYLRLISQFELPFTGKIPGPLVPKDLEQDLESHLALGLILNGVCRERTIAQLQQLQWGDIPKHVELPIAMPHPGREQYYWFWPLRLVRLLLEGARHRRVGKDLTEAVFKSPDLAGKVRSLLARLCAQAKISCINIEQVIYFSRLHVRQVVTDPVLAVWLGLIPFRPRPIDQINVSDTIQDLTLELPLLMTQTATLWEESQPHEDVLDAYHDILKELQPDLESVFNYKKPPTAIKRLQDWMDNHRHIQDIPVHNLCLLVGWLLSLLEIKKISPQSREVYWIALKRIWKWVPSTRIEALRNDVFDEFVTDDDNALSSRRTTMRAWRSLLRYFRKTHISIEVKELPHVMGKVDSGPVRILPQKQIRELYLAMERLEEKIAIYLAYRLSLRVSEVCNLLTGDFYLGEEPFVYIAHSKFGKNRRVNLEFLPKEELENLRRAVTHRLNRSGPGSHFLITLYGRKLESGKLSERTKARLKTLGLCDRNLQGQEVTFHSFRRQGLNDIYHVTQDLRAAAGQAGHSLVLTTTGSYMSDLDLEGVECLKDWDHPLNNPDLHLPLLTLAVLSGKSDRRLAQLMTEFNSQQTVLPVVSHGPKETPDGERPKRPGKPAEYISIEDAIRLLN